MDFLNVSHLLSPHVLTEGFYNTYGYRCPEFTEIDWNNSVVMFGCSNCVGVGLKDDEIISSKLSAKLNVPVINLGIKGSSISTMWMLNTILKEKNILPKAIILLYTEITRFGIFKNNKLYKLGTWSLDDSIDKDIFMSWSEDSNSKTYSIFFKNNIRQLWNRQTKIIEASFFKNTSDVLEISFLETIDKASDNMHGGIETAARAADFFYERFKNERIY